jgi:hypothetical protein
MILISSRVRTLATTAIERPIYSSLLLGAAILATLLALRSVKMAVPSSHRPSLAGSWQGPDDAFDTDFGDPGRGWEDLRLRLTLVEHEHSVTGTGSLGGGSLVVNGHEQGKTADLVVRLKDIDHPGTATISSGDTLVMMIVLGNYPRYWRLARR